MKYEELIEKFISDWSPILTEPILEEIVQKILNQVESKETINIKNRQDERFKRISQKTADAYDKTKSKPNGQNLENK